MNANKKGSLNVKKRITKGQKRALPFLLAVVVFMQMLDTTILNTSLPAIAVDFSISPLSMQSVVISYTLTLALLTPLSAFLAERIGTRRLFLLSILLFVFGSLLAAAAMNFHALILGRVIQGIGGAFLTPTARLTLISIYPRNQLMPVLNYAIMPALAGPMIGPALGGYLTEVASWHWIFLINIPIGLTAFIIGMFLLPSLKKERSSLDFRGYLLFTTGLFLLIYGFDLMGKRAEEPFFLFFLIAGIIISMGYWVYAKRQIKPLFSPRLWQIRTYRIGLVGNLVARVGMSALPFVLPLYLQLVKGYSPSNSGLMLIAFAISGIAVKPMISGILTQLSYRRTLIINTFLMGLMMLSITFFGDYLNTILLMMLFLIMGGLNSIQFSTMNSLSLAKLRGDLIGTGSTLLFVNQQLALSLGVAISTSLLNYIALLFPDIDLSHRFQVLFGLLAMISFLSILLFSRLHHFDGRALIKSG